MYSIKNGNIYFSKNVYNPFQERTDAPWAYDLYRMPFDGKEDEAELLVRNVIGEVLHKGSKIYYCPYDSNAVEMVFSYLMPGEEDLMPGEEEKYRTYVYDDTNGSMSVYDEETGMRRNLFSGLDMIIRDIMGTTEDGVIVYGTDYRDVVTVGERKDTDASSYYDKTRYFFISWDGSRIEELPIEKNWPGPIVFS